MSKTKILTCSCKHPFQDQQYGKGRRVFNKGKTGLALSQWKCTVCGRTESRSKKEDEES